MPDDKGLKKKLKRDGQEQLVRLIEDVETKHLERVIVCQSVGFHDDLEIHRHVVDYLASIGCETFLAPDGKPESKYAGTRK